jgi:hypothetical protein
MKKAFAINGGAGRVLCAIPALENYKNNVDSDVVIIAEAWMELFMLSPTLRHNVYHVAHKGLFEDKLKDREIESPEPYRLNAYFNQKANLIQAFDKIINNLDEVPDTKPINLELGKTEQVYGHNLVNQVKAQFGKDKAIVIQPFGSGIKLEGNFVVDTSGRSLELRDFTRLVDELSKSYAVILMVPFKVPTDKPMQAAVPEDADLIKWAGIINACDYFLGCDSVGQHLAHALKKPATVIIGATFPENICYPDNKNFTIIDNGKDKRTYSPIRITHDHGVERDNEDLMILSDETFDKIIKGIQNKLGKPKKDKQTGSQTVSHVHTASCSHNQPTISMPNFEKKYNGVVDALIK